MNAEELLQWMLDTKQSLYLKVHDGHAVITEDVNDPGILVEETANPKTWYLRPNVVHRFVQRVSRSRKRAALNAYMI